MASGYLHRHARTEADARVAAIRDNIIAIFSRQGYLACAGATHTILLLHQETKARYTIDIARYLDEA